MVVLMCGLPVVWQYQRDAPWRFHAVDMNHRKPHSLFQSHQDLVETSCILHYYERNEQDRLN